MGWQGERGGQPDWLPKIGKGPGDNPVPLLTWTVWSERPDLNRRGCRPAGRQPVPAGRIPPRDYHRLRVGQYRVVYIVESDLITVERVDRVTGA